MEGSVARAPMLELFDINVEVAEPGLFVLTAKPTAVRSPEWSTPSLIRRVRFWWVFVLMSGGGYR